MDEFDRIVVLDVDGVSGKPVLMWEAILGMAPWGVIYALGTEYGYVPHPVVADVDNDGVLEILVGESKGGGYDDPQGIVLHVIRGPSTMEMEFWSTPVLRGILDRASYGKAVMSPCTVMDVDNDPYLEVFHGTNLRHVMAWDPITEEPEDGWPIVLRDRVIGEITIADIEGSGGLEVVASDFAGWIHVWDYFAVGGRSGRKPAQRGLLAGQPTDRLNRSVPNPFNPLSVIEYEIGSPGEINLSIFSAEGRLVKALVNAYQEPDRYSVVWDGRDEAGGEVASGVYFYRLTSGGTVVGSRKMILLK